MSVHKLPCDLGPILACAERVAARLARQHQGPLLDLDDIRQDLLLDLLIRLRSFNAARSSITTFATICFQHRAARLGCAARREHLNRHPQSLDALVPGATDQTLAHTLSNEDGLGAWLGQDADPAKQAEERLDLDRALSGMPPNVVPLCVALLASGQTQDGGGLSRTTLHRRVQELRCRLLAAGVGTERGTHRRARG